MKKYYFIVCLFTCLLSVHSEPPFRVMFYNTENLFDTIDNPRKNDNEFLPQSKKYWNSTKYWTKLKNQAKLISTVGEWNTPALIGMCEVENGTVLEDLTLKTPLKSQHYKYVITDCADSRGINVALLYQRDQFKYISHHNYRVYFPRNKRKTTRDVLHVSGRVLSGDTLDVFVCHLPSRRGGELESEPDRAQVASLLRSKSDSLMQIRNNPCIILMGDMNDEPSNKSMSAVLNARPLKNIIQSKSLYNLFYHYGKQKKQGSYKFQSQWNMLDQIIVSGTLLDRKSDFYCESVTATIFGHDLLLTEDKSRGGKRPKKTFHGMKYEAGFSDHLPVYVDFYMKK